MVMGGLCFIENSLRIASVSVGFCILCVFCHEKKKKKNRGMKGREREETLYPPLAIFRFFCSRSNIRGVKKQKMHKIPTDTLATATATLRRGLVLPKRYLVLEITKITPENLR